MKVNLVTAVLASCFEQGRVLGSSPAISKPISRESDILKFVSVRSEKEWRKR